MIHPIIALENAKNITSTNPTIDDAILHHMWPLKTSHPSTSVGWIIQAVDNSVPSQKWDINLYFE